LEALVRAKGDIALDIVATREDADYWRKCKKLISKLQFKVDIESYIDLPHAKIKPLLEKAHLFVLPTEGENFGHAIFEALAVGCPVLISDQTPWRNLESKKAGIDLPLSDLSGFTKAIQTFVDMGDDEWQEYRNGALALARDYENNLEAVSQYKQLFEDVE
jgi:glycosyltransferase involved in cell wall biosynthesis